MFLTSNEPARDANLPPRAKAVYYFLSSHGKKVRSTTVDIAETIGMGKGAVSNALNDLIAAGYITREVLRGENGQHSGVIYALVDNTSEWGEVK